MGCFPASGSPPTSRHFPFPISYTSSKGPPAQGGPFEYVWLPPWGGSCQRPRPLTDEGQPRHATRSRSAAAHSPLIRRFAPPSPAGEGFYICVASPLGGSCQRPRPLTDEGQPRHATRSRSAAAHSPLIRRFAPPSPAGEGFYICVASPLGGSCQRPRPLTDEGQPRHATRSRSAAAHSPLIRRFAPPSPAGEGFYRRFL